MFEKNMQILEKKNPSLAKKIRDYGSENIKGIEVFESESKNFIISYKGVLLHSIEDPLRETKAIWHKTVKNELKTNDIQMVYGLGLGYLFKRAYISANSRILLFEPSLDILRFVMENVDFTQEFADERVTIIDSQEDAINYFSDKYLAGDKVEVLFLPSYLNLKDNDLLAFSNNIYEIIKDKNIDQNTAFLWAKQTTKNILSKFKKIEKYKPVDELSDLGIGKTALVLSAGPSLKKDIELIKENQEKFIKIAILPIVPFLLENGIKPDFITIADPSPQLHKIEKNLDELKDVSLVVESRSDIAFDDIEAKSKYVYFSTVDRISEAVLGTIPGNTIQQHEPVASVAILAFELAKIMGCTKIIFSGLDLAFTENRIYADNYIQPGKQEGKYLELETKNLNYTIQTTKVKSADNSEVTTRADYLIFIKEFAKLAKENPFIKMINTAQKGALINGMHYKPFEEAIENETEIKWDINAVDSASIKLFKEKALSLSHATKKDFDEFVPTLNKGISALKTLIAELKLENPDSDKFQKIFTENLPVFTDARNFATQNIILSTYLQSEITNFIASYSKDSQITIEKLKSNLSAEKQLLEETKEAIEVLKTYLV